MRVWWRGVEGQDAGLAAFCEGGYADPGALRKYCYSGHL